MREERSRERQAQARERQEQQQNLAQTQAELARVRQRQSELESQLGQARAVTPAGPEANLPLVMLEATRAGETVNEIALPKTAQNIVLWIEPGVGADFDRFRLTLQTAAGQHIETIEGLRRNAYGALVVSLPAAQFSNTRAGQALRLAQRASDAGGGIQAASAETLMG